MSRSTRSRATTVGLLAIIFLSCCALAADRGPEVVLSADAAGPRTLESATGQAVVQAYRRAWQDLSTGLEQNSGEEIVNDFVGPARSAITTRLAQQRSANLRAFYQNQIHHLQIVFYAPEGDVMELHDTAEYDLRIADGENPIHNQHEVQHYVILMTPGADRWVIRQMQAVPQF